MPLNLTGLSKPKWKDQLVNIPQDLLKRFHHLGVWGSSANELRATALTTVSAPLDKELTRFMAPTMDWSEFSWIQGKKGMTQFGSAWCADLDSLPFRPSLLEQITVESLHPLGKTLIALCTELRVLYVPPGIKLETTLDNLQTDSGAPVLFCLVDEGAELILSAHQRIQGIQLQALMGRLAKGAQVTLVHDRELASDAYSLDYEQWVCADNAYLTVLSALSGGKQSWAHKEYQLGRSAQLESSFYSALGGNEQAALTTTQRHTGPGSSSAVLVKTVLFGAAQSFYRGTIQIEEQAPQSCADQQQKALILGERARTCAIPSLEVATHEVQCKHGSAAGRCNIDELRYLLTRGFDEQAAQNLLIEGFYTVSSPVIERLQARCRAHSE